MLIPKAPGQLIQIAKLPNQKARVGDTVSIQVIKHLAGDKWAISFMGKVYPAKTAMTLQPDQLLKVKIIKSDPYLQFKVIKEGQPTGLAAPLKQLGLPTDPLTAQITAAFIKSQQAVHPEMVLRIREKLAKEKKGREGKIGLFVNLIGKKIDITSPGITALMNVLDFGSGQEGAPHQDKRNLLYKQIREMFMQVIESGVDENLLQVFNHLKSDPASWVVIPYQFYTGNLLLSGQLKLLLDNSTQEIKKAVLIVMLENEERWSFFLNPDKNTINVLVFSNKKVYINTKGSSFCTLISNLKNIGIKIDDKIYDDKYFDGFYPLDSPDQFKTVNTVI